MTLSFDCGEESGIFPKTRYLVQDINHIKVRRASVNNLDNRSPIHKQHRRFSSYVPQIPSCGKIAISQWDLMDPFTVRRCVSDVLQPESMERVDRENYTPHSDGNYFPQMTDTVPPIICIDPQRKISRPINFNFSEEQSHTDFSSMEQDTPIPFFSLDTGIETDQMTGMEDPVDFITRQSEHSVSPSTMLMISPFTMHSNNTLTPYGTPASSALTTGSCTPATSLTSMSRQSSVCGGLPERADMIRFSSITSLYNNESQPNHDSLWATAQSSYPSPLDEDFRFFVGAGGITQNSQILTTNQVPPSIEIMVKSQSEQSSSSLSSSSSSRSFRRLQEQNNLAGSRPIVPKEVHKNWKSEIMASPPSSSKKVSMKSTLSKSNYQRPKHHRVYCRLCSVHSDGFRGEHELRRHNDREHNTKVLRYICVKPSDGREHPEPVLPLSECKACSQHMKKYNAYYNAAAHLRRAHFNPKSKTRSKNILDSRRGGKGGGDWPSMTELKLWMKEVEESHVQTVPNSSNLEAASIAENESPKPVVDNSTYAHDYSVLQVETSAKDSNFFPLTPCEPTSAFSNSDVSGMNMNLDNLVLGNYCTDSFGTSTMEQQLSSSIPGSCSAEPHLVYKDLFNYSLQNTLDPL